MGCHFFFCNQKKMSSDKSEVVEGKSVVDFRLKMKHGSGEGYFLKWEIYGCSEGLKTEQEIAHKIKFGKVICLNHISQKDLESLQRLLKFHDFKTHSRGVGENIHNVLIYIHSVFNVVSETFDKDSKTVILTRVDATPDLGINEFIF